MAKQRPHLRDLIHVFHYARCFIYTRRTGIDTDQATKFFCQTRKSSCRGAVISSSASIAPWLFSLFFSSFVLSSRHHNIVTLFGSRLLSFSLPSTCQFSAMRWFAFQSMGLAALGLLARSDGFQSRLGGGRRAPRPWCAGADAAAALTPRRAATSLLSAVPSYTPFDAERPIDPSEITFGQYLGAIGVLEVRGAAARWQQRGDRPPSTARSPLWERLSRSRSPVRFSCASLFTGPSHRSIRPLKSAHARRGGGAENPPTPR